MLEEMARMHEAVDKERRMKMALAKKVAKLVAAAVKRNSTKGDRERSEREAKLKKVAAQIFKGR